jgi:hypothetical protein
MARVHQTEGHDRTSGAGDPAFIPLTGGYLTDGEALFHIERTLVEDARGDLLVELEDCATLELIVCSARSLAQLALRTVQPLAHSAP